MITRRRLAALLALPLAGLAAAACSPLATFNALVPKDGGSRVAARGLAYGLGPRRMVDVYAPTEGRGPFPVMVFAYGGNWASGDRAGYAFVGHAMAAQGFLTFVFDYRLVPEVRYPAFVEDTAAAIRFARDRAAEFGGDPDRIVLSGHSAGAYNVAQAVIDRRYLREAGVPRQAIRGVAGLAGPYDFFPFTSDVAEEAFKGIEDGPATQPVNLVRGGEPAFFLAWGTEDDTVKPPNSEELARQLRRAGVRVETRAYKGVGHAGLVLALARPLRGRAGVLEDLARWARGVAG
ncbi:alpha/beta hydrolase [Chthonobacter albigriseus]|uniref:alpha/beta hydrolase n=1 Tax=Chthonobacter albigriseus TaxID=1683161 RepID=UPI0015EF26CE|nr:alpha/beta hydrolase [Chthonobacter albigriseus]